MKANEFIEKYGVDEAKRALLITDNCSIGNEYFVSELERLIESHNLVFEHGSLAKAKEYVNSKYTAPEIIYLLLQAIADVESCQ